jgi:parallel beta-helix repeat protein
MKLPGVFSGILLSQLVTGFAAFGQGSLTPPGAPGATMKSLDQIQPRTDVLKLGGDTFAQYVITQPGSYFLSTNIVMVSGFRAIEIKTNDVTLDLSGFTIFGSDRPAIFGGVPVNRIRIFNGHLANASSGIDLYTFAFGTNIVVENMQMAGASGNVGYGMIVEDGCRISHCQITGFGSASSGGGIYVGDRSVVENCELQNNYFGMTLGSFCRVENCLIQKSVGSGINAGDNSVVRNNQIGFCSPGISCGGNSRVEDNNCTFCAGIGINIGNSFNRVENNQVNFNFVGINAGGSTTNFVARNTAHGNTNGNYSLGSTVAGPTSVGIGVVTNHPWANFSY